MLVFRGVPGTRYTSEFMQKLCIEPCQNSQTAPSSACKDKVLLCQAASRQWASARSMFKTASGFGLQQKNTILKPA